MVNRWRLMPYFLRFVDVITLGPLLRFLEVLPFTLLLLAGMALGSVAELWRRIWG